MFSINNIGTWQPKIGASLAETKKPKLHRRKRQKEICVENIVRLKKELKTAQFDPIARERVLTKLRKYEALLNSPASK